jgi:hypothetical protein
MCETKTLEIGGKKVYINHRPERSRVFWQVSCPRCSVINYVRLNQDCELPDDAEAIECRHCRCLFVDSTTAEFCCDNDYVVAVKGREERSLFERESEGR